MEEMDYSKYRALAPLDEDALEGVAGGAGKEEKPWTAPHCPSCGTYDVRLSVECGSDRGHCDKCYCSWDLAGFHQSKDIVPE